MSETEQTFPATASESVVTIAGLGLDFSETGKAAFHGIDLTLEKREIVAIIGPSGCGKSTLLKSIAGLLHPTAGSVQWHQDQHPEIAYIFQDPTLLPWLTALHNVELPLKLQGVSKKERLIQCKKAMTEVLLEDYGNYHPRALSGGMRMRVSLARALTLEPELLFLDEPFAALDAMTRNQMNQLVLELQKELGWSALMVTHSVIEAVYMADRVCVMTASPGTFKEIVPIELPSHRTMDHQTSGPFLEYVSHIRGLIGEELVYEKN